MRSFKKLVFNIILHVTSSSSSYTSLGFTSAVLLSVFSLWLYHSNHTIIIIIPFYSLTHFGSTIYKTLHCNVLSTMTRERNLFPPFLNWNLYYLTAVTNEKKKHRPGSKASAGLAWLWLLAYLRYIVFPHLSRRLVAICCTRTALHWSLFLVSFNSFLPCIALLVALLKQRLPFLSTSHSMLRSWLPFSYNSHYILLLRFAPITIIITICTKFGFLNVFYLDDEERMTTMTMTL